MRTRGRRWLVALALATLLSATACEGGRWPDVNFYRAWKGFEHQFYEVGEELRGMTRSIGGIFSSFTGRR